MSAVPKWSTACTDWQTRIVKAQTLIPFAPLFHECAVEALDVFNELRVVDAANSPTFGEICRPWIGEFVAQIFGSYENETGVRHITEYFMLISKKNGKSTTAAGIMLTALILNWRMEAEFIILSPTIEIANNSFKPAAAMVRADPELNEMFLVQDHIRTITHRDTGASLKVVAADSNTVSGKKAVGVLVDELWLFGKDPKAEAMLMEATGGLASRPEGFIIYLTTQSDEPPAGVFKTKLDYARQVRDGKIDDPQFLPVIYEFPDAMLEKQQHMEPENFYVTNPNLTDHPNHKGDNGGSVNVAYIQRLWRKAQMEGDNAINLFLAKHLNVQIGLNLLADRWPGADYWGLGNYGRPVSLDYLIEWCEVITAGVDGGGLDDLLGLSACGRHKVTGELLIWTWAWANPSVLKRRLDIVTKLRDFAKAKEMTLTEEFGQDVEECTDYLAHMEASGLLYQIGFDPNMVGLLVEACLQKGIPQDKMVSVNQGYRLAGAIKTTEVKLAQGVIKHGNTGLMAWCVGNAKVKVVGNAIVVTKQVSGTAKIDPLMAVFNAVKLMEANPEAQNDSYNIDKMVIGG